MGKDKNILKETGNPLRRGWTTGACATAATKSALHALLEGDFLDPVHITLPGGQRPAFVLNSQRRGEQFAEAGIVKDGGDDPDVTHGAQIIVRVSHSKPGSGICFIAGEGVGTVSKAGLPIKVGQAAINPVPRKMMGEVIEEQCAQAGIDPNFSVLISVPNGNRIAQKTWNPRLGILGGISILGTTGIVIPYSCSAWIHSIHSGIDVARAQGLSHLVGCTGHTSEQSAKKILNLPDDSFIDMGDFVGGMLKYLRQKPVEKITIAGGFAKMSKLAQGAMDLHSKRSEVDINWLSELLEKAGATPDISKAARAAHSGNEVLQIGERTNISLGRIIADKAAKQADMILKTSDTKVQVLVIGRNGRLLGQSVDSD